MAGRYKSCYWCPNVQDEEVSLKITIVVTSYSLELNSAKLRLRSKPGSTKFFGAIITGLKHRLAEILNWNPVPEVKWRWESPKINQVTLKRQPQRRHVRWTKLNHMTAVDGCQEWKRGREEEHQEIMNERRDGYGINNYYILWTNMYTLTK